ncbi:F0F1 ATP synthase subunit B [Candidatus Nomurabacteria bacterium]|nr:F0F1 ATP synthase subunit B [Candidatus Nomurabacteria bacterium]
MEILDLFGVNWKLMLAQLVNFAIVVFVLWRFAIKPLMKVMEERNKEISQGLEDANSAAEKLQNTEKEVKAQLNEAKQEAMSILEKGHKQAEADRQTSIDQTKEDVKQIVEKAKDQISAEKTKMVQEVKKEAAALITESLNKILLDGLSKEVDQKYIKKSLAELENEK